MCTGSSGSSDNSAQTALAQQQLVMSAQQSAAQLAEQQREFNVTQQQSAQSLANTQALQAQNQAQVDQQAQLTDTFDTGRAAEQASATKSVNDAFSQFTPDYYKQYAQAYTDHYDPQVEQQFGLASNQTDYGLARSGNLQSQTAADQFGQLAQQKGTALDDINNAAVGAATTLQSNVNASKQNLLGQATSDSTLGSPVTPGSADAITAQFNNTSQNLSNLANSAGDTVTTLGAQPSYSSLGSLFGSAASGATAASNGNNQYLYGQAYNSGAASAANPTTASSGAVR